MVFMQFPVWMHILSAVAVVLIGSFGYLYIQYRKENKRRLMLKIAQYIREGKITVEEYSAWLKGKTEYLKSKFDL